LVDEKCTEHVPRLRGRIFERARVCRSPAPICGVRIFGTGEATLLKLFEERTRTAPESECAGWRASGADESTGRWIKRRAARSNFVAAAGAGVELRSEARRGEKCELERAQPGRGRRRFRECEKKDPQRVEEAIRRLVFARQIVREFGGVAGVGESVQIVAQTRVGLDDIRFAQREQLCSRARGDENFTELKRLERTAEPTLARACAPREDRDPATPARKELHDLIAVAVRQRAQNQRREPLRPQIHPRAFVPVTLAGCD
jgi:hypothetical protein